MLWILLLSFIFIFDSKFVHAQSNASCLPFYDWTYDAQRMSPCDVASSLLALCTSGPYPVAALPQSNHYEGPSLENANSCQCNTVTYSLMSACGACQGQVYQSWSVWSANCPDVYLSSFPEPIPSGVSVPGWAYLDVTATDNFDQTLAKSNANLTESTAVPTPTSSTTTSNASQSSLATVSMPATTPSSSNSAVGSSSSNPDSLNADVVGGLVGGLFGLFLISGVIYWHIHYKRRLSKIGRPFHSPSPADLENAPWRKQGPYLNMQTNGSSVVHSSTSSPSLNSSIAPASPSYRSTVSVPSILIHPNI